MDGISSLAKQYVRTRTQDNFSYTCKVERVTRPSYDEETLHGTAGGRTVIWQGNFRLWEIQGSQPQVIGDTDLMMEGTQASFPHDAPLFRKDDEIVILNAPDDEVLNGTRYQIQTKAVSGALRPSRRYTVSAVSKR